MRDHRFRAVRVAFGSVGVGVFCLALPGCSDGSANTAPRASDTTLWGVVLDQHAVTISTVAPHDTVRITGHAISAALTPLADVPVVLSTGDSGVSIGANGLVTARFVQAGVRVIATARQGNLTIRDTVMFNVTANPVPAKPARLEFTTGGEDSVFQFANFLDGTKTFKSYVVTAFDANGNVIPDVIFHLQSADTNAVTVLPAEIFGFQALSLAGLGPPEHVTVYADADVYGVPLRDSIPFVVTTPAAAFPSIAIRVPVGSTTPIAVFSPDSVVIAPGGMVQWSNPTATPVDIVFDNPAAATEALFNPSGDGNIAAFKADSQPVSRARVFLQAGVYPFHSALNGTSGKVVVRSYP